MLDQQLRSCSAEHHHHLYPLVALQIGDIQSYVSRLFLFITCSKSSLVFLVDNGPWSKPRSTPAELWQLILTKSRASPFANKRLRRAADENSVVEMTLSESITDKELKNIQDTGLRDIHLYSWDNILGTIRRSCRKLVHTVSPRFHGCVAFEVSWGDVRGMNYLNELQTDTCLALEVQYMRKREFDCLHQAVEFYGSQCELVAGSLRHDSKKQEWCSDAFPKSERQCLDESGTGIHRYREFSRPAKTPDSETGTGIYRYREFSPPTKTPEQSFLFGTDYYAAAPSSPAFCSRRNLQSQVDVLYKQEVAVTHTFRDAFVVFRFSDPLLPFELQEIITSNQRLLQMLESGLQPWVMFLQSYPILCQLYRPWMRPLARSVYFLVSVVTVIIGFYDLYKNVPLLKATAAHMLGPFFEWIESWEMVSRLKYLGTMLVLQNYEKAFIWVVMSVKAVRQLVSLLMRPVMEPLLFLWEFFLPFFAAVVVAMQSFGLTIGAYLSSMVLTGGYILSLILWPFCVFLSTLWSLVYTVLCPVLSTIRVFILLPVFAGQYLRELWTSFSSDLFDVLHGVWDTANQTAQFMWTTSPYVTTTVEKAPRGPSVWRLLWDDLFSKVFRGVRYILNGLVTFFAALNRHRLSIYNNVVAFLVRMLHVLESGRGVLLDTWHRLLPDATAPSFDQADQIKED